MRVFLSFHIYLGIYIYERLETCTIFNITGNYNLKKYARKKFIP